MNPEKLIPQPELRRLFGGVSDMTIWRWRASKLLPAPIVINRRNFYRSSDIAAVQERLASGIASNSSSDWQEGGDES